MPPGSVSPPIPLPIPLARWADRQLRLLASETGSPQIAALEGQTLLGERGSHGAYRINGPVSAGIGGSRLMPTRDAGWFALTIIRAEDRDLLPALFIGRCARHSQLPKPFQLPSHGMTAPIWSPAAACWGFRLPARMKRPPARRWSGSPRARHVSAHLATAPW